MTAIQHLRNPWWGSYAGVIRLIFNSRCTGCHGGAAGVPLTSYSTTMASGVVVPGNAAGSLLYNKVVSGHGVTKEYVSRWTGPVSEIGLRRLVARPPTAAPISS